MNKEEQLNRACGVAPNDMPGDMKDKRIVELEAKLYKTRGLLRREIRRYSATQAGNPLDYDSLTFESKRLLPGLHEALRLAYVAGDSDLVVGRIMKRISELEGDKVKPI